jgi:hypothetical protein
VANTAVRLPVGLTECQGLEEGKHVPIMQTDLPYYTKQSRSELKKYDRKDTAQHKIPL